MGSETPVRNQFGTIIGLRQKEDTDPVQTTLEASLKAVGVITETEPTPPSPKPSETPQRPSWSAMAVGIVVLSIGVIAMGLFSGRTEAPPHTASIPPPTITVLPTTVPTKKPAVAPAPDPRKVTLVPITLYGDYDEQTKIGFAPVGLVCTLAGQSPDDVWAYLACPAPTGNVWARVKDLGLSAEQSNVLMDTRVISRAVPTGMAFSPAKAQQDAGPARTFCADRSSIWGKTHQCATTQAAADALADSQIAAINATAVAINQTQR